MVELMVQNTSKSISKLFLCLVFNEIKLKLVSNCFFASIKRYIKEELSLIKEWKKFRFTMLKYANVKVWIDRS